MINNLKKRSEIHAIVLAISEAKGNEAFIELAEKNNIKYLLNTYNLSLNMVKPK
jgi:hypothetical protein